MFPLLFFYRYGRFFICVNHRNILWKPFPFVSFKSNLGCIDCITLQLRRWVDGVALKLQKKKRVEIAIISQGNVDENRTIKPWSRWSSAYFFMASVYDRFFISAWNRPLEIAVALLMWFRYDRKTVPVGRSFSPKKKAPKKLINIFFFSIKKNYEWIPPLPFNKELGCVRKNDSSSAVSMKKSGNPRWGHDPPVWETGASAGKSFFGETL